jgi:hypothetical protein
MYIDYCYQKALSIKERAFIILHFQTNLSQSLIQIFAGGNIGI